MSTERITHSAGQEQFATRTVSRLLGEPREAPSAPRFEGGAPAIGWRELFCLVATIVLWDVAVYQGGGFAGWGLVLIASPVLLAIGAVKRKRDATAYVVISLLAILAVRMFWCGSILATLIGMGLLVAAAMALSGIRPYLENWGLFLSHIPGSSGAGAGDYGRSMKNIRGLPRSAFVTVGLPMIALVLFATIFLRANPEHWTRLGTWVGEWLEQWREYLPTALQIGFWLLVGGITIAWLRPGWLSRYFTQTGEQSQPSKETMPASLYQGYRNTLLTVIALFSAYLAFEFHTLWFTEFADDFHYSGYCHEGAFWLTVALGLSTIMLSAIFQGSTLNHPSLPRLKTLAWIWSGLNLLLAVAVFHRLFIYIDFNGMTRMRVVAMLGVSAVIAGFCLVLAKIVWNKSFLWLFRRQIWAVSIAAWPFVVLPVDMWVNWFNVRQVLSGNLAPSVQIAMHSTSSEGRLQLAPLLECEDAVIRDGVRAMLIIDREATARRVERAHSTEWTDYQLADDLLLAQYSRTLNEGERPTDEHRAAVQAFKQYAYQWW